MSALILVTCLLSGADCRPHLEADKLSHMECQVQSMRAMAQYAGQHPKRKVIRAICTDERRVDYYLGRDQA